MASFDERPVELPELLGSLSTLLLSTSSVEGFLDELALLACEVVEPRPSCGITTRYDHRPITIASSDPRAVRIDQEQYAAGDGPCLHAMRTGQTTVIADQRNDQRWAQYRAAALAQGVRWVLSLPLRVNSDTLGALNVYGYDDEHALEGPERAHLEAFAGQAATALALAVRHSQQRELSAQLEQALSSRSVIDQAIGVIMAQQRCSPETAFDLLRQRSQNSNRKLRDIAAELILRFTGTQPTQPPRAGHSTA
jgi:GAF domain-containing protein